MTPHDTLMRSLGYRPGPPGTKGEWVPDTRRAAPPKRRRGAARMKARRKIIRRDTWNFTTVS